MDEEAGEEEESPAPATIVQRVFGGRLRTCFQGCAPPPPKIDIQKELQAALETVSTAATCSDTLSPGGDAAPSPSGDNTSSQPQPVNSAEAAQSTGQKQDLVNSP